MPSPQPLPADPEAGRYLGLSGRTLEKHRTYGTGPRYRKIGGRVVYALNDLEAWAADSDDAAHLFRDDRAHHSEMMPPIRGVFVGGLI
ncbi:hypothetical protein OCL97_19495 [Phenylobacterium sp. HK31G]|uniref:DNA-binding protein n=1 Tax=Phenylobacterium ferrooxidans TaxID=2982689 RepID=A0ABW6CTB0_9CAUL